MLSYSEACVKLVKSCEGCRLEAYQDDSPAKIWTIGYGHTANVKPGMKITLQQTIELLREDLDTVHQAVDAWVDVPLTQGQVDALCSFAYNVGLSPFLGSTLLRKLNAGAPKEEVAAEFPRWNRSGAKILPGLVKRREAEARLFLS